MPTKVRILLVEDVAADAELAIRELKRAGIACDGRRVDEEGDFRRALVEFKPDLIISDFAMPRFDGMHALAISAQEYSDVPFIFVSGNLGEEYAIRALKNGATDYVLKTNLVRLPAAVERALEEARKRREHRQLDSRLRESEAGLTRAQTLAKLAHIITVPGGGFEKWSATLPGLLGVQDNQVPTSTRGWLDIVHPDDREFFRTKSIEAAVTGIRVDLEYRLRHATNRWIHVRQVIEPLDLASNMTGQWFCTLQDITDQKLAEERIERLNRVHAVLSGISALIVRIRDRDELLREACRIAVEHGKLTVGWISVLDQGTGMLSPVARAGLTDGGDLTEPPVWLIPAGAAADALREQRPAVDNAIDTNLPSVESKDDTLSIRRAAIKKGAKSVIVLPLIVDESIFGVMSLYASERDFFDHEEIRLLTQLAADVSFALEFLAKAEKVNYLAYFDPLTELPNRALFCERLAQQLHTRIGSPELVAVVLIDVERLRMVNDTLGRQAGDEALRLVARRLNSAAAKTRCATPGRVVADCFGVIVRARDANEVAQIIEDEMRVCFGEPFQIEGKEIRLVARAGVATFPADAVTAEGLLQNAEAALRTAKRAKERFAFYAPAMNARVAETLAMETKLRKAIELRQFVLHYQPKFHAASGKMSGVEALIRWNDPDTGLVPPLKFIYILEETGMIFEVGRWALHQALADQQLWARQGLVIPRVAVNVSAPQLRDPRFVQDIQLALEAKADAQPALELEITESLLMEDIERNIQRLKMIRDLGVTIAIDDFGTGYSSLNYLARLPLDSLKIDRSFVADMTKSNERRTIVSTVISLAHSLGLKVVAEGVETGDQQDLLRSLRCDELQGFLLCSPVPSIELASLPAR